MTSSSPWTACSTVITGCTVNTKAGSIEQNLWMVTGSSQSISIWPPHSPTRITKKSILKWSGFFHWPNTSRIRFWAFSYSIGEPCGLEPADYVFHLHLCGLRRHSPKQLRTRNRTIVKLPGRCKSMCRNAHAGQLKPSHLRFTM